MTKEELTGWALANGWRVIAGHPSLTKPGAPNDPIVRLVLKATVVNLEVRKPAGKWEKVGGESYARVVQELGRRAATRPWLRTTPQHHVADATKSRRGGIWMDEGQLEFVPAVAWFKTIRAGMHEAGVAASEAARDVGCIVEHAMDYRWGGGAVGDPIAARLDPAQATCRKLGNGRGAGNPAAGACIPQKGWRSSPASLGYFRSCKLIEVRLQRTLLVFSNLRPGFFGRSYFRVTTSAASDGVFVCF